MFFQKLISSAAVGLFGSLITLGSERPNILFIAIDDLNDWIGCMEGHPQAHTPNLDRLAARGVLFTNAHCASPACQPSRAAVFTGLRPSETEVWTNRTQPLSKLRPDAVLLPEPFGEAGYRTLGTGKLIHDRADDSFQDYFAVEQRWGPITRKEADYTPEGLPTKGTEDPRHLVTDSTGRTVILPLNRMPSDRAPQKKAGESFDWGPWEVPDQDFGDTQITDWAIEQLADTSEQPLLLAMGYYRPHIPLWAPKRFFDRFEKEAGILPPIKEDDLADLSETGKHWALFPDTAGLHASVVKYGQWEEAIEAYLACVSYIDHEVGRVLDALEKSQKADNTIIVVWSDHGWHLGEKQHWGKWTGWERSTKVPLIIVPPAKQASQFAQAGSHCSEPVSLLDLFPTLTEWCQVKPPAGLAGQSLLPLLRDPSQATGRAVLTSFDQGNYAIRTKHWRYIRYADGSEELYNHQTDPNEWTNLVDDPQSKDHLKELRKKLP